MEEKHQYGVHKPIQRTTEKVKPKLRTDNTERIKKLF